MTSRKSERLLNLLIMLLVQRRPVGKQRIRAALYPSAADDAFEKMFERDKDELRALGVPIEVGSVDPLFDEPGYLVRQEELGLPDLTLEPDEAAVLSLAGRAWQNARLSSATRAGLRKLAALGVPFDEQGLDVAMPRSVADEPTFELFWEACQHRVPIRFNYQAPGRAPAQRTLEPWGVVRSAGRWYVVGHDRDRGARRTFRLSRVLDEPIPVGGAGEYQVPEGIDLRRVADSLTPRPDDVEVHVLLRPGRGHGLRQRAVRTEPGVRGPDGEPWDEVVFMSRHHRAVSEVLGYGADAVLLSPEHLRDLVVERLEAQRRVWQGQPS